MRAFGAERPEIPLHVVIAQAIVGPALLAADEMLELHWIADKEDGRIISDHVKIAVFGVKFHREPARITPGIRATALTRHGGKTHRGFHLHARLEELCFGITLDVPRYPEMAERAAAFGVWLAFRDTLAIKVRHLLDQVMIVEHNRTITPNGKRMLVTLDRNASVGCGARSGFFFGHVGAFGV